jgi:hypothetical protein
VLKRIHVTYRLTIRPDADREGIERVHGFHAERCPVYRSIAAARDAGNMDLAERLRDFRFHDLRHEGTSRLVERTGWAIPQLKLVTGHKTDAMLARYTHLRASELADEMARIDGVPLHLVARDGRREPPPIEIPQTLQQRARWRAVADSPDLLRMLVEAKPITAVAAEFGVSDVAVHKACRKHGIEKMQRGHWLRRA